MINRINYLYFCTVWTKAGTVHNQAQLSASGLHLRLEMLYSVQVELSERITKFDIKTYLYVNNNLESIKVTTYQLSQSCDQQEKWWVVFHLLPHSQPWISILQCTLSCSSEIKKQIQSFEFRLNLFETTMKTLHDRLLSKLCILIKYSL